MKNPRLEVGELITYKPRSLCENKAGYGDSYWEGGDDRGNTIGRVIGIYDYIPEKDCYRIDVTDANFNEEQSYVMLECEFLEYHTKITELESARSIIYKS